MVRNISASSRARALLLHPWRSQASVAYLTQPLGTREIFERMGHRIDVRRAHDSLTEYWQV